MRTRVGSLGLALLTGLVGGAACGAEPRPGAPSEAPITVVSARASNAGHPPKLCGCSLCEPIVSDDACTADVECAPATPCHAERCIGSAKATALEPHQMCTQKLACGSVDTNACGCLQGKCALYPRANSP